MTPRQIALAVVAVVVAIMLAQTLYVVEQREQAIVVRLGEPVRVVNANGRQAGLHVKVPLIEDVRRLDRRNIAIETDQEEIVTAGQGRLVVDAFLRYRITDPLEFYRTLRDEATAADRIERLLNSSLREVLGSATQDDIVSKRRGQIMQQARADMARRAKSSGLGIEVIDVRIKRADYPDATRESVFRRMATAREESGQITGEGDAQRTRIFANSFGKDASFAAFFRSMQAYEQSFSDGQTTMVLSPDSAFFRYFERGPTAGSR